MIPREKVDHKVRYIPVEKYFVFLLKDKSSMFRNKRWLVKIRPGSLSKDRFAFRIKVQFNRESFHQNRLQVLASFIEILLDLCNQFIGAAAHSKALILPEQLLNKIEPHHLFVQLNPLLKWFQTLDFSHSANWQARELPCLVPITRAVLIETAMNFRKLEGSWLVALRTRKNQAKCRQASIDLVQEFKVKAPNLSTF